MTRVQRVELSPPSRSERYLLPLLLVAAWLLAASVVHPLWREVWPAARDGIGVFDSVLTWYGHLAMSMICSVAGLGLSGFGLGLWWVLRPLQRGERRLLALALPAVLFAAATPWLMQDVALRGQARAMATFAEVMQPAVAAMEAGRLTDEVCTAAATRVVTALPRIAYGQPNAVVTVAKAPPESQPDADRQTPTLMVSYRSSWVAWDPHGRRWLSRSDWYRRPLSPP